MGAWERGREVSPLQPQRGAIQQPRATPWEAGYGAFSIGQSMVVALKRYIANQKQHHRRRSFQDEFRDFLAKYEIEYDERYVWD